VTADVTSVDDHPEGFAIRANGLGARTRRGWIYRDVTCAVRNGEVAAIVGPAGSGRTSLLLTMAARMAFSTGSLTVCGEELPHGTSPVRARVAVARAGGATDLEPELRVRDHLIERGAPGRDRDALFDKACGRLGLSMPSGSLVGDLDAFRVTLLAIALALLDEPRVVLLDDLDRGLAGADQTVLWQRLRSLTEDGTTVLAVTTDPVPGQGWADVIVELEAATA
jgi:ABC-2 type transport system ATP-binding protein